MAILILNEPELVGSHRIKWFQILLSNTNNSLSIVNTMLYPNKKVTEWEIAKTEVENEMEIFIALRKYNTCRQHEEDNYC